jgi:hypothetical protein
VEESGSQCLTWYRGTQTRASKECGRRILEEEWVPELSNTVVEFLLPTHTFSCSFQWQIEKNENGQSLDTRNGVGMKASKKQKEGNR